MAQTKIPKHPSTVIKEIIQAEDIILLDVANGIGVSENSLKGMLKGKQYLSPVNAIKIARFFDKPDSHFLVLQAKHQAAIVGRNKMKIRVNTLSEMRAAIQRERVKTILRRPENTA